MTTNIYNMKNISTFYAKIIDFSKMSIYNEGTKINVKDNSYSY